MPSKRRRRSRYDDCRYQRFHQPNEPRSFRLVSFAFSNQSIFRHFHSRLRRHILTEASPGTGEPVISERAQNIPQPAAPPRFPRLGLSQVWVRFLLALIGLMLAFAAALFSTVAREAGNVWGMIILASAALLLATFVGLTTVPYLARRVVATRVREAMDYDVTRAGLIYILISVVIGIAAINTGNNLLYVIVAALLSAILVSGIASAPVPDRSGGARDPAAACGACAKQRKSRSCKNPFIFLFSLPSRSSAPTWK